MGSDSVGNVVLTGFMGTGKSTVGRVLADRLDVGFIDTDALIEERHGAIADIFATRGEATFRELEHDVATELAQRHNLVIATGGRMLLDERNAAALDTTGTIFCLSATLDELAMRLLDTDERSKRPLLDVEDPKARIAHLLAERADGYGQFRQVDTTQRSVEDIVRQILHELELLQIEEP